MKLENQVCSLEQAKKLKELGVKQDGLWWWVNGFIYNKPSQYIRDAVGYEQSPCSTFTVAELGEMLPEQIYIKKEFWRLNITKETDSETYYLIRYSRRGDEAMSCGGLFCDISEADARAKMLIYLIENEMIEI